MSIRTRIKTLHGHSCSEYHVLQWAKAQEVRGTKCSLVLLADRSKEELDAVVATAKAESNLDIMARRGRPYSVEDLDLVNAAEARTIIIMDPDHHTQAQVRVGAALFAAATQDGRKCCKEFARGTS